MFVLKLDPNKTTFFPQDKKHGRQKKLSDAQLKIPTKKQGKTKNESYFQNNKTFAETQKN